MALYFVLCEIWRSHTRLANLRGNFVARVSTSFWNVFSVTGYFFVLIDPIYWLPHYVLIISFKLKTATVVTFMHTIFIMRGKMCRHRKNTLMKEINQGHTIYFNTNFPWKSKNFYSKVPMDKMDARKVNTLWCNSAHAGQYTYRTPRKGVAVTFRFT